MGCPEQDIEQITDLAERRATRVELVSSYLKMVCEVNESEAERHGRMLKYTWIIPSAMIIGNESIQPFQSTGTYIIDGIAVVAGVGLALTTEKLKNIHANQSVAAAKGALRLALEEPPIPVPDWVKRKLDIEEG